MPGLQLRVMKVMEVAISREVERLERRLTFLATVGSTAPFVGLFGTVWGIMASFQAIGSSNSTTLVAIAPGIAEALFATALGLLAAVPAVSQDVAQSLELSREAVDKQKRIIVAGSLPLSDEEADAFWPLFDEFQKELKKLDGRSDRLIASYTAELPTLTDARARSMLDEALSIDEDRAKLMRKWSRRMDKVLPPRLLVRYFQLENKFHAIIAADLARQIPLVP